MSPFREALRLSWPATLSMLLHAGYRVNDQYWIQDLGADAQAALGVTSFFLILNFGFINVFTAGALARMAKFTGANDPAKRETTFAASMQAGLAWFVLIGLIGWFATPWLVQLSGAKAQVAVFARDYLSTIYLVLPLIALKPVTDSIYLGLGNTFLPMLLAGLAVGLNFILNPILIYGWGPIPAFGIAGAAWATGASKGLAGMTALAFLHKDYAFRVWKKACIWLETVQISKIGLPVGFFSASYAIIFILLLKTSISPLGSSVQAGLGVAFNGVESLAYCGLMGPAMAASSLVGRALGAKDPERARQGMRACFMMSLSVAAVFTGLFLFIPNYLAGLYTNDPGVMREASRYLWIVGWSQIITACDAVLLQAMTGAGRTFRMSIINTVGFASRIPLAWLLSSPLGWGAAGIWWALNISNLGKLIGLGILFRKLNLFAPTNPHGHPSTHQP